MCTLSAALALPCTRTKRVAPPQGPTGAVATAGDVALLAPWFHRAGYPLITAARSHAERMQGGLPPSARAGDAGSGADGAGLSGVVSVSQQRFLGAGQDAAALAAPYLDPLGSAWYVPLGVGPLGSDVLAAGDPAEGGPAAGPAPAVLIPSPGAASPAGAAAPDTAVAQLPGAAVGRLPGSLPASPLSAPVATVPAYGVGGPGAAPSFGPGAGGTLPQPRRRLAGDEPGRNLGLGAAFGYLAAEDPARRARGLRQAATSTPPAGTDRYLARAAAYPTAINPDPTIDAFQPAVQAATPAPAPGSPNPAPGPAAGPASAAAPATAPGTFRVGFQPRARAAAAAAPASPKPYPVTGFPGILPAATGALAPAPAMAAGSELGSDLGSPARWLVLQSDTQEQTEAQVLQARPLKVKVYTCLFTHSF